jgi:hypothetical protein
MTPQPASDTFHYRWGIIEQLVVFVDNVGGGGF